MPTSTHTATLLGDDFLTEDELSRQLDVSKRTIARWNSKRQGPPRIVTGRTILYRRASVLDWLTSREQTQARAKGRR
jgi:predicted DNA-binding transcriptional regulator AlpA